MSAPTPGQQLDRCLDDALYRLRTAAENIYDMPGLAMHYRNLGIDIWPQDWPNTGGGISHKGGQVFIVSPCLVVSDVFNYGGWVVYHGWEFAYHVRVPSQTFREAFDKRRLKHAKEYSHDNPREDAYERGERWPQERSWT